MRIATRLAAAAAAVLAAGAVAACGNEIDNGQMEDDIREQMSAQAGVDASQVSVSCPEGEEAEEGNEFECTLTAPNGDEVLVEVTITNDGESFEATVPEEQFQQGGEQG